MAALKLPLQPLQWSGHKALDKARNAGGGHGNDIHKSFHPAAEYDTGY